MQDGEATAIAKAINDGLEAAWLKGDGTAFASLCGPDADFINLIGIYVQGREAIAQLHQQIFDGFYAGSVMRLFLERARFVSSDVVVSQSSTQVDVPAGPVQGQVRGVITMVLTRAGGTWLISAFQNTKREGSDPHQAARIAAEMQGD